MVPILPTASKPQQHRPCEPQCETKHINKFTLQWPKWFLLHCITICKDWFMAHISPRIMKSTSSNQKPHGQNKIAVILVATCMVADNGFHNADTPFAEASVWPGPLLKSLDPCWTMCTFVCCWKALTPAEQCVHLFVAEKPWPLLNNVYICSSLKSLDPCWTMCTFVYLLF